MKLGCRNDISTLIGSGTTDQRPHGAALWELPRLFPTSNNASLTSLHIGTLWLCTKRRMQRLNNWLRGSSKDQQSISASLHPPACRAVALGAPIRRHMRAPSALNPLMRQSGPYGSAFTHQPAAEPIN